ncbi:MAG: hypothetical protein K5866_06350 [Treponema sp.]|nr:hypothetical protein [Treponema sp.]
MNGNELNLLEEKILEALKSLKEKQMFTEAILVKKIRDISNLDGKKKAGLSYKNLEKVVLYLGQESDIYYSLHLNSANDILIKKAPAASGLSAEARVRRQSSEKTMSILTVSDFSQKKNRSQSKAKRSERKKINIHSNFEDFE